VILGLGLDVVEVARIRRCLEGPAGARFVARCFTEGEQAYCDARRDRATHYAARFAAKEAASKALGVPAGITFHDVEVVRDGGAPTLRFHGVAGATAARLDLVAAHLALTHDGGVAAATVVLEGRPGWPVDGRGA
jgi:holo-[acyl-carrier protein] synthase